MALTERRLPYPHTLEYLSARNEIRSGEQAQQGTAEARHGVMDRQDERELRDLLVKLRAEHRELDDEIVALESNGDADQLQVTRLKKRKLKLKDQITKIEDRLLPDIIA